MAKATYSAHSALNAIRIVELLCESDEPLGARAICRETGLNSNMVFRLLKTLQEVEWIAASGDETRYVVTLRPYHYVCKPLKRMSLMKAAHLPLRWLWQETGESCYLGVIDGTKTLFLEHLDATADVRITATPGGRFLMHCAAPGKVLLAYSEPAFVDRVVEAHGLPSQAPNTVTKIGALRKELAKIRRDGYAVDNEEFAAGLICHAAPVFNHDRALVGTVGLSVLTLHHSLTRMKRDLGPKVLRAAEAISAALGYPGHK